MARSTSIRQGLLRNLLLVIILVGGGIIAVSVYAARHMLESLAREVIGASLDGHRSGAAALLRARGRSAAHRRPVG